MVGRVQGFTPSKERSHHGTAAAARKRRRSARAAARWPPLRRCPSSSSTTRPDRARPGGLRRLLRVRLLPGLGRAARWGRRSPTASSVSSAASPTCAPVALFAAGACSCCARCCPAVRPFKAGRVCLLAALMLGLAAGSLGLGPDDPPRDARSLDADYFQHHGGARGRGALLGLRNALLDVGAHILFVFLMIGGRAAADRRLDRRVVTRRRARASATTTERVRAPPAMRRRSTLAPACRRCQAERRSRPSPPDVEPVVRATHVEAPAPIEEPSADPEPRVRRAPRTSEPEAASSRGARRTTTPSRTRSPRAQEPSSRRWATARSDVTEADDIDYTLPRAALPQALERRAEGRPGKGTSGRARSWSRRSATSASTRRSSGTVGGPARDALRAAAGARDQDVEGREPEGRPGLRAGGRPTCASSRRSPASRPWASRCRTACADGAPRRRLPGGAGRAGRR